MRFLEIKIIMCTSILIVALRYNRPIAILILATTY